MNDKKTNNEKNDSIKLTLPLNRRFLKYVFVIVFMIFALYVIVAKNQIIVSAVSFVFSVLSPILIGLCFAYVVNLLLRPIERFWMWIWHKRKNQDRVNKLKRPICLILSILVVVGTIFAIMFMIAPAINDTIVSFVDKMPKYAKTIEGWYNSAVDFMGRYNFEIPEISLNATKITQLARDFITNYGNNVIDTTVDVTTSIVSTIVDIVLGIVFSIYLLSQKEKIGKQTTKTISVLLKPKRAQKFIKVTSLANNVFTKFITGQLTEACIIGVLCCIGMLIFGMPHAVVVSVLIGFTSLVPIFGPIIGAALGAFLILLEEPMSAIWFIVFIIVLQQIESNLIYPKVVGKSVGLPGIWVLSAVTVGGGLFGIVGMLFSVPVCSVLYVMFREYVNRKSKEYQQEDEPKETQE